MSESKGTDTKTMVSIGAAVVIAIVLAWVASTQATAAELTRLQPQIERAQSDIARLESVDEELRQWQIDWQRGGQLPEDVQQNERILQIQADIEQLDALIFELRAELQRLQIQIASTAIQ